MKIPSSIKTTLVITAEQTGWGVTSTAHDSCENARNDLASLEPILKSVLDQYDRHNMPYIRSFYFFDSPCIEQDGKTYTAPPENFSPEYYLCDLVSIHDYNTTNHSDYQSRHESINQSFKDVALLGKRAYPPHFMRDGDHIPSIKLLGQSVLATRNGYAPKYARPIERVFKL